MRTAARRVTPPGPVALPTVPRLWSDETAICLGGGPSLTAEDVNFVRGRARVIAINDAYRLAPWADVLYAADASWWQVHRGVPTFTGLKYSLSARASIWPGVQVLRNTGPRGLDLQPTGLRTGCNSGYQAVNLAVHFGATRIVLLGYDMQRQKAEPSHWFGEHPPKLATTRAETYRTFRDHFASMVEPLRTLGIDVINCSRRTALTVFPCRPLEDVLTEDAPLASGHKEN